MLRGFGLVLLTWLAVMVFLTAISSEPPSMVFSYVQVGEVDGVPLYEIHFPGHSAPCYLARGVMGGMASGQSASLACP
jgi:hypothetical protein